MQPRSTRHLTLAQLGRSLGAALVPVSCPGCGLADVRICRACATPFAGPARTAHVLTGSLPPWWRGERPPAIGVVAYQGASGRTVLAWKDHGRADLTPLLALALGRAIIGSLRGADLAGTLPGRVGLVPVPSSRWSDAARGGNLVRACLDLTAERVHRAAAAQGVHLREHPVLERRAGVQDQAGLGVGQRARNLRDTLRLNASAGDLGSEEGVILVDDVVTTGASLDACARALAAAGMPPVIGAAVVAVTPHGRDAAGSAAAAAGDAV